MTYSLPEDGVLRIDYAAVTDRPTVVNLTNHSYFNLAGEGTGSVLGHIVQVEADAFAPTDATQIPTGALQRSPDAVRLPHAPGPGDRIREGDPQLAYAKGYDHTFVLRGAAGTLRPAATCIAPDSGRRLDVWTTQPAHAALQRQQSRRAADRASGRIYRSGDGVCFETQGFPDAPNQPAFPSAVLRPGETFAATTEFRFSVV